MSKAYDDYLSEHIANVKKAIAWMRQHDILTDSFSDGWTWNWDAIGMLHDASKESIEEYDAYDDYFYGRDEKDEDDISVSNSAFDYAWLHHIHCNPHHWQHWVLIEDEGVVRVLEMPMKDVYEMIADWWSFSWKNGNLHEIFEWYEKHKEKMKLHPKTRIFVEWVLDQIRAKLKEGENAE